MCNDKPPWCVSARRHRLPCVGLSRVHCWLSCGNWTTGCFSAKSPAEQAALICTSTPEERRVPQSASSWSCEFAVMDIFACGQKEGCDLCSWVAGKSYSASPRHLSLLPSPFLKASHHCHSGNDTVSGSPRCFKPLGALN